MAYRYKKNQIFRKKLNVPKEILDKVYKSNLSLQECIEYDLGDKIPASCIRNYNSEREIIQRFGYDKIKGLDLEALDNYQLTQLLLTIDPSVSNVNSAFYEVAANELDPRNFTTGMKEKYPKKILDDSVSENLRYDFYNSNLYCNELIENWDIFKDKDLSNLFRKNNFFSENGITEDKFRTFVEEYYDLISVSKYLSLDFNILVSYFCNDNKSVEERKAEISESLVGSLDKMTNVSNDVYNVVFKHADPLAYLESKYNNKYLFNYGFVNGLNGKSSSYLFETDIPFVMLLNDDVMNFVSRFGYDNVATFDRECGHLFTANNCEVLKNIYKMNVMYAVNQTNSDKSIFLGKGFGESYTYEEFFEVIRRMIVYNHKFDHSGIIGEFRNKNEDLFISNDAPKELKDMIYNKKLDACYVKNNPNVKFFLDRLSIELLFEDITIGVDGHDEYLSSYVKDKFGADALDVMLDYSKYIGELSKFPSFTLSKDLSKEDVFSVFNSYIYSGITSGKIKYDEYISVHFKKQFPRLFLSSDVPKEIKDKFYNRELQLQDFLDNPDLIDYFKDVDIAAGLEMEHSWLIGNIGGNNFDLEHNKKKLKLLDAYLKIEDVGLRGVFVNFVSNLEDIDSDKIDCISDILCKLENTNSSEMYAFKKVLAEQLILLDNPMDSLNKIEDIFLRNNIPVVGKVYSVFEILHPKCSGFNFENSIISPVLQSKSTMGREIVIFSDLIKACIGSNNRSMRDYLSSIEVGNELFLRVSSGEVEVSSLNNVEKQILTTYAEYLNALYNKSLEGKKSGTLRTISGDLVKDVSELKELFSVNGSVDYDLPDRIVSMFCHFAGFDSFMELKQYLELKAKQADIKNRNTAEVGVVINKGDFIKGVGDVKYLSAILQNGSVSKEFLGSAADSDMTPLDTDLSKVSISTSSLKEAIDSVGARNYGPIWFVLKNDDRFITTRKAPEEEIEIDSLALGKLEAFYTGAVPGGYHYGVRTGFASSEIDYMVVEKYDPKIGVEIAKNGFYIPVVDKSGAILFSPRDYDNLRAKMAGASYYGCAKYELASEEMIVNPEMDDLANSILDGKEETKRKRDAINGVIASVLGEMDLGMKTSIDGNLSEGVVELIDTGSTGRYTNVPGDGDFDFMMRLDRSILSNPKKLGELKEKLLVAFGKTGTGEITDSGDFRLKGVSIAGLDVAVDIDISFTPKTDKVVYSTDMAISDRLQSISEQHPELYPYVVSNIIMAKQLLKENHAYKSRNSTTEDNKEPDGGMGGVGVENWILQNGGSFKKAAESFLRVANRCDNFAQFQREYSVWDFGENHMAARKGFYPHDNFVTNNMSEAGYNRMKEALSKYLSKELDDSRHL